jgi:quinoprotein glucose dehydrogenase
LLGALAFSFLLAASATHAAEPGWPAYGGDQGGQRFSPAAQITPANVTRLKKAWRYSTGDMKSKPMGQTAFEDTPILADGRLYVCSPFNEISALDPGTGKQLWRYDPHIATDTDYPNGYVCRGVTFWHNPAQATGVCSSRIFAATNDLRLIALDAATGKPCPGFGDKGTLTIIPIPALVRKGEAQITSAPVVSHGVIVVGSSLDDNQRVREVHGTVHGFDAVTGALKWNFDPIPRTPSAPNAASWSGNGAAVTGGANVWAPMSVDEARGLVFLPTTSPSPDFFGGMRPGDNRYADSVVALNVTTGQVVWAFQVTHHDVWDYDVPAQPTLGTVTYKGRTRDAVIQTTKQGLVFTLDRETGQPLIPVEERTVPRGGAPGEQLWPTQPFPVAPKPLTPTHAKPDDAYGLTFWDKGQCHDKIGAARAGDIYTPPSLQGTILYPFTGGGSNWGGLAFDAGHDVVYVNTSSAMHLVTLIKRDNYAAVKSANPHKEVSPQTGTPYGMKREALLSPWGLPCNAPPWGMLHAIDMHDGHILWEVPLGTTEDLAPFSEYLLGKSGTPNFGGPIVTGGGLVFIGAAMDNYLRAFDAKTGEELWRGRLPAGGQATPMTYMWKGRQYVVIAAGGHYKSGTKRGDKVVAFALPQ